MEHLPLQHNKELMDTEAFAAKSLALLGAALQTQTYPGYPPFSARLRGDAARASLVNADPADATPPDIDTQRTLLAAGLQLDTQGRPLHPWVDAMIDDPNIGIVTGRRFFRAWGPNYTADPIITRQTEDGTEVLLIQRSDTGTWALPGGFIDPGESGDVAAAREAGEETGINPTILSDPTLVYDGPIADIRMTAHAWPHTYAYRFDVTGQATDALQPDPTEVKDAAWINTEQINTMLYGSHSILIALALANDRR